MIIFNFFFIFQLIFLRCKISFFTTCTSWRVKLYEFSMMFLYTCSFALLELWAFELYSYFTRIIISGRSLLVRFLCAEYLCRTSKKGKRDFGTIMVHDGIFYTRDILLYCPKFEKFFKRIIIPFTKGICRKYKISKTYKTWISFLFGFVCSE